MQAYTKEMDRFTLNGKIHQQILEEIDLEPGKCLSNMFPSLHLYHQVKKGHVGEKKRSRRRNSTYVKMTKCIGKGMFQG